MTDYVNDLQKRMDNAIEVFNKDLKSLRTGRASPAMLDAVKVEAYGSMMPIDQVGTVTADSQLLAVQVWDKSMIASVEKAIINANLGFNPAVDGQLIRIPVPPLSEERRNGMIKLASEYAEKAKIAVRNVRRDILDKLKTMKKNSEISEDDLKAFSNDVEDRTKSFIEKIDSLFKSKKEEIAKV